jgi:hypothetical protein
MIAVMYYYKFKRTEGWLSASAAAIAAIGRLLHGREDFHSGGVILARR